MERYRTDPEYRAKVLGWQRAWRAKNKTKVDAQTKARRQQEQYKEKARVRSARWREKNREQARLATKAWNDANPDRVLANMKKYKLAKNNRCPAWLTGEDHAVLRAFYAVAKLRSAQTGYPWEVDHIVPLRGSNVSGLHLPMNLRVVPKFVNRSKHNRHEV